MEPPLRKANVRDRDWFFCALKFNDVQNNSHGLQSYLSQQFDATPVQKALYTGWANKI